MYRRLKIESSISNLRIVENAIDEVMTEIGISQENYGKILVSTLEAVNNAIMHGNRYEQDKMVDVEISYKNEKLKIKISDEEYKTFNLDWTGKVILVAEDEDTNYFFLHEILEEYNATVIRAFNGQDAVNQCTKNDKISFVLMDIKMPVMDGYEATRLIKS